ELWRAVFVAQPEGKPQIRTHAPLILNESREIVRADVARRGGKLLELVWNAHQEVGPVVLGARSRGATETELAVDVEVKDLIVLVGRIAEARLDRVRAVRPRQGVLEGVGVVDQRRRTLWAKAHREAAGKHHDARARGNVGRDADPELL